MPSTLTLVRPEAKAHPIAKVVRHASPFPELSAAGVWYAYAECEGRSERKLVVGNGKGANDEARQLSAVGEAIERHHFFSSRPMTVSKAEALGQPFVTPESLGLFTAGFYRSRTHGYHRTSRNVTTEWSLATDLHDGTQLFVPHEGGDSPRFFYRPTTSGWAAHRSEQAEENALLELVERDALLLSWYLQDFGCELTDVEHDALARMVRVGLSVRLFCVTKDIPVPVVWGWVTLPGRSTFAVPGSSLFSSASALQLRAAVSAVLYGLIQKLENFGQTSLQQQGPWVPQHPREHILYYLDPTHRQHVEQIIGSPPMLRLGDAEMRFSPPPESSQSLSCVVSHITKAGYRALVVDETQAYARYHGLRVVRAVVPGLLSMSFGSSDAGRISLLAHRSRGLAATRQSIRPPERLPPHPFA